MCSLFEDSEDRVFEDMSIRTPRENADAIWEALEREDSLVKRVGRYRVILAILEGAEMREERCGKCGGGGSYDVTVESSGGTWYSEKRKCPGAWDYGCDGTGKVRRLQMIWS